MCLFPLYCPTSMTFSVPPQFYCRWKLSFFHAQFNLDSFLVLTLQFVKTFSVIHTKIEHQILLISLFRSPKHWKIMIVTTVISLLPLRLLLSQMHFRCLISISLLLRLIDTKLNTNNNHNNLYFLKVRNRPVLPNQPRFLNTLHFIFCHFISLCPSYF